MAKRQKRISFDAGIPKEVSDLINSACTLVKMDNSVIFVTIVSVTSSILTIRDQRKTIKKVPTKDIREIIVDSHA